MTRWKRFCIKTADIMDAMPREEELILVLLALALVALVIGSLVVFIIEGIWWAVVGWIVIFGIPVLGGLGDYYRDQP